MLFAITVAFWIVFVVNAGTFYQWIRFVIRVSGKFEDLVKRHRSNVELNGHGWLLSRLVATGLVLVVLRWVRNRTPDVTLLEAFAAHPYLVVLTFGGCLLLLGRSIWRYAQARSEMRRILVALAFGDGLQRLVPLMASSILLRIAVFFSPTRAIGPMAQRLALSFGLGVALDGQIENISGVIVREKSREAIRRQINRLTFDMALRCAVLVLALATVDVI